MHLPSSRSNVGDVDTPRILREVALAAGTVLVLAACGSDDRAPSTAAPSDATDLPSTLDTTTASSDITNVWFPLEPGTRWTYRETDEEGDMLRVVVTVSTQTKQVADGVEARIVRDTVTQDGEVVEDTRDWYAQDADGNVWYLGEDTAEFEDGKLDTTKGSWEAGVDGAEPGVIMPAEPAVGMAYRQEYLKGVAEDRGEVIGLDGEATVPAGSFDGLVQTADTDGLEPKAEEHKSFARGVGEVLTVDVGSDAREELLAMTTVSAAEARRAATVPLGKPY